MSRFYDDVVNTDDVEDDEPILDTPDVPLSTTTEDDVPAFRVNDEGLIASMLLPDEVITTITLVMTEPMISVGDRGWSVLNDPLSRAMIATHLRNQGLELVYDPRAGAMKRPADINDGHNIVPNRRFTPIESAVIVCAVKARVLACTRNADPVATPVGTEQLVTQATRLLPAGGKHATNAKQTRTSVESALTRLTRLGILRTSKKPDTTIVPCGIELIIDFDAAVEYATTLKSIIDNAKETNDE